MGCRDCSRCTERGVTTLLKAPARAPLSVGRAVTWRFRKLCPECGHPMKYHEKRADGSFKD